MQRYKKTIIFLSITAVIAVAVLGFLFLRYKMPYIPKLSKDADFVTTGFSYPFETHTLFVDFEDFEPGDNISDKNAYSGSRSCVVNGKNSFSPIIKKPVADIGLDFMKRAGISAKIYVYPQNIEQLNAHLVFAVTDESGNNVFWSSVGISHKFFEPNVWTKVSGAFDLEAFNISDAHTVNVYLWNDSKTKILIDDIFVVLGKDTPLTGDTIYCFAGLNGQGLPPHNHPPYKMRTLDREKLNDNNLNKLLLVQKNTPYAEMNKAVVAGNFFNTTDGLDKIVFKSGKQLQALVYCETLRKFEIFIVNADPKIIEIWDNSIKLSGCFVRQRNEGIIIADTVNNELYILSMSSQSFSCNNKSSIKAETQRFSLNDLSYNNALPLNMFTVALTDGTSGLMAEYKDDKRAVFILHNSGWIKDASKYKAAFADTKNKNEKYFRIKQKSKADLFLKYQREPGFDMHLMSISDTAHTVLNKIDFNGYNKDYNPKFYEVVSIISGCFISNAYTSLIVVCTNCLDKDFDGVYCAEYVNDENLPDAVHLFSFR